MRDQKCPLLLARLTVLILLILIPFQAIHAQAGRFTSDVHYNFGENILFSGNYSGDEQVTRGTVYFQVEGEEGTRMRELDIQPGNQVIFQYNPSDDPIRAFSAIDYWFELELDSGKMFTSPHETLIYEDNRFDWQERETDNFHLRWYEGDGSFSQSVLDVAELGLDKAKNLLPFTLKEPVEIYAYGNAVEMRSALQSFGKNWVGAHADPDLAVMVLSLPPGPEQRLEMERQIPHELMHILLYQNIGPGYANLPVWLNEGLASIAELYPNPDFLTLLEKAQEKDTLPTMDSLCRSFPRDASGAYLAYAQAASFTRYLHQQYGSSMLQQLIKQYQDGLNCQRGIEATYDLTLPQLDRQWRQDVLGENIYQSAFNNLLPWFILLGIILLVPFSLLLAGMRKRIQGRQPG
jgi:hypothetical protein